MSKILVTAKCTPDLDGVACALGYAELIGDEAISGAFGEVQSEVEYFIKKQGIVIDYFSDDGAGDYKNFILVDASSMKGMPKVVRASDVIEIIDHREGDFNSIEIPNAKVQLEMVGAAATLIVERFISANKLPSLNTAKLLYGAIFHNTLNFLSTNTNSRDFSARKYLEETFYFTSEIVKEMFKYSTEKITSDLSHVISQDAKQFSGFNGTMGVYQLVTWNYDPRSSTQIISDLIPVLDQEKGCDWSFLSVIDVSSNKNYIYATSPIGQKILTQVLKNSFENNWLIHTPMLLRKQIMPLLKQALTV